MAVPLEKDDPIGAALLANPGFSLAAQDLKSQSHRGLPLRLKWYLLVAVLGWKCDAGTAAGKQVVCEVELGEDGHYWRLETPAGMAEQRAFGGEEGEWPRQVMTSYHQRSDKLRVSLKLAEDRTVEVGYCRITLKDLVPGKPRTGSVKIKCATKEGRKAIGAVKIGMLLSAAHKAEVLFLLDSQEKEVLFYQESETLVDLNPVFVQPSMTPFRWKAERGVLYVSNAQQRVLATLESKRRADTSVVDIVLLEVDPYWQCTVTHHEDGYRADGCWQGSIAERAKGRAVIVFEVTRPDGTIVARAQWRNARDLKLSVDAPDEDPAVVICVMLAVLQIKFKP